MSRAGLRDAAPEKLAPLRTEAEAASDRSVMTFSLG